MLYQSKSDTFRDEYTIPLTFGTSVTQSGSPPFKSGQCTIPVRFTEDSMNAGFAGPPNISCGNVAFTGPYAPWKAATDCAPFARSSAFGGVKPSACDHVPGAFQSARPEEPPEKGVRPSKSRRTFFMYANILSQFHPTSASSSSSSSDHESYCAFAPLVQNAPLMDELPPSVFPLPPPNYPVRSFLRHRRDGLRTHG